MSSLLWKYYFENDVEQFRRTLARATYNAATQTKTQAKAKTGSGGLSTSPGSLLSTSPTLTKGKRHSEDQRIIHQQGSAKAEEAAGLSRAEINWKDVSGVTLLHRIASSNIPNASEFAQALLQLPLLDLYIQDEESGWTALHRALYFGNIYIARLLMDRDFQDLTQFAIGGAVQNAGGLIKIKDHEGYSPFDVYGASIANRIITSTQSNLLGDGRDDEDTELAQGISGDVNEDEDSRKLAPRTQIDGDEIFAFGSNKNFTLGFGDEDDRQFPERIQLKRPDHLMCRFYEEYKASNRGRRRRSLDVKTSKPFGTFEMPAIVRYRPVTAQDVQLSKLHSAILTTDPEANLYMCGFGSGGRLGTGDETTRFGYVSVHGGGLTGKKVIHIALGQNHTIAISDEGDTFTWGSNGFGQLGYASNANGSGLQDEEPVQLLPRQVFGPLKHQMVVGAAASRIHSAVITASSLFTFGKNEGQMGLVDSDARSLISQNTPRKVGASLFTSPMLSVSAIEKATICLLQDHEMWVFANYGYTKVSFPVEAFSNYFLDNAHSMEKAKASRQVGRGNEVCKITSGGDTICAMTSMGDVFTMQVSQKTEASTAFASTTNPTKIRGALSPAQRAWSQKKAHMAVKDVDVGQDGSIIICTEAGSVWRRIKRAKIKDATIAGLQEYKAKDYKFSRVPGLTRISAVRSNTFGAYAAVRRDCDVLHTQVDVDATLLWKDLYPLLPFHGFAAEDSDTENPSPRFWVSSQQNDIATIRRAVLTDPEIERNMASFLADITARDGNTFDLQVGTTISDVRIPIHIFMLAGRSTIMEKGIAVFRDAYFFSIPDVVNIEYDKEGKPIVLFHGLDFITLLNLVLYIYTDSVVDVWQYTRRAPEFAYRYRQIRTELMKTASHLELSKLEHAVRLMAEPPKTLHDDFGVAIASPSFFDNGDVEIELDGANQLVHGALMCQRCPFFEGLFQGRAAGQWLSSRRDREHDVIEPISINLAHINAKVFQYVLRHIYADADELMFDDVVVADLDAYLDLIIEVMSVANELMLDRLAQCCQKVLGRYVNTRNVCQLLNAVAPCSVTEFKAAALEYICLNLEGMLENHLLGELDDDIMLELDEAVCRNQLAYLPIAKSGRVEQDLYERYPALVEHVERSKRIRIDQVGLQSRLREKESRSSGALKASSELLEDFEPSTPTPARRSPRSLPRDQSSTLKSPQLRSQNSANDLIFHMDESDDDTSKRRPATPDRSGRFQYSDPSLLTEHEVEEVEMAYDRDIAASASPSSYRASDVAGRSGSSGESKRPHPTTPWSTSGAATSRLGMKEIMQQASTPTSALSSALANTPPRSPKPTAALSIRISQKERKRQLSQQFKAEASPPSKPGAALPQTSETLREIPSSPWQKASSGAKISLKDVIGAEASSPSTEEKAIPRTPSPMTLRQTVAGKPSARRAVSGPAATSAEPAQRAFPPPHPVQKSPLAPPRSLSTYNPSIQSVRHISSPSIEPILQLSMSDILSQQHREKEIIKEAAAKRSLQEIQEEQAFQEWWESESRKVQEEQEAAGRKSATRGRVGRGGGKTRDGSRGRGRGRGRGERGGGGPSGKMAGAKREGGKVTEEATR